MIFFTLLDVSFFKSLMVYSGYCLLAQIHEYSYFIIGLRIGKIRLWMYCLKQRGSTGNSGKGHFGKILLSQMYSSLRKATVCLLMKSLIGWG